MRSLDSAIISYGATLPPAKMASDGNLFFKTAFDADGVSNAPGLYIYHLQQDFSSGIIGDQVGAGWRVASRLSSYVEINGTSSMTGSLTVGGSSGIGGVQVKISGTSVPGAINFNDGVGTTVGAVGWSTTLNALNLSGSWVFSSVPKVNNDFIWTAGNDGATSGLDADLLDGQHGTYYLNLSNSSGTLDINLRTSGVLSLSRGGTGLSSATVGGIVYAASSTQLGTSSQGIAGQLLVSNGAGAPSWINQSAISSGSVSYATSAGTANYATSAGSATTATSATSAAKATNGYLTLQTPIIQQTTPGAYHVGPKVEFNPNGFVMVGGGNSTPSSMWYLGENAYLVAGVSDGSGNLTRGNLFVIATQTVGGYTVGDAACQNNFYSFGDVIAYASDARLKKNVLPIEDAIAKVKAIGGYTYDWDMQKATELGFNPAQEHEHGLIAQEVQKVIPDAVVPAPFNREYLTVKYQRIVPVLVAAINEQQAMIQRLEERLAALEKKV